MLDIFIPDKRDLERNLTMMPFGVSAQTGRGGTSLGRRWSGSGNDSGVKLKDETPVCPLRG